MAVYDNIGRQITDIYSKTGELLSYAYNINGQQILDIDPPVYRANYDVYSYTQKWASKGLNNAQGFDIYDGKVFWVYKSGNASIPADCYVFNLSDGSQALSNQYVTIYSGHGNNICFDYPKVYASPAYPPSKVYVNELSNDFMTFTLVKTLTFNDGTADLDCCIDENNKDILWTYGHISGASTTNILSKWDLSRLTDNGDETYTPKRIHSVNVAQPQNTRYYQGCKFHDNILWFANGYTGSSSGAYVFGVNPYT